MSEGDDFATYWQDYHTGFEYAMNRYYSAGYGRYAYSLSDPANKHDPAGLYVQDCFWTGCAFNSAAAAASFTNGNLGSYTPQDISFVGPLCANEQQNEVLYDQSVAIALAAAALNPDAPPDPKCVQDAITAAAAATGLTQGLSALTGAWVQIVGEENGNGGTYSETELNFSGTAEAVQDLLANLCDAGYASNGQCGGVGNPLVGPPHLGFSGNFRSPGLLNSVQVNTAIDLKNDSGHVQIDVDPYNPSAFPILGLLLHGILQVLPNKISGTDNTYGCTP